MLCVWRMPWRVPRTLCPTIAYVTRLSLSPLLTTPPAVKFVLLLFCNAIKRWSTSVGALALDHLADIVTNGVVRVEC